MSWIIITENKSYIDNEHIYCKHLNTKISVKTKL